MTDEEVVAEIWFMIAGRIAPELCCTIPPPDYQIFRKALHEVLKKDGDLDKAVFLLNKIITTVPDHWMVFEQAGQLLNVIGWRKKYHPGWFDQDLKRRSLHPGRCGQHVAHAYALMQSGADDDALTLTSEIISKGDEGSDDIRAVRLIRAAIYICQGDYEAAEDEIRRIESYTNHNQIIFSNHSNGQANK